MGKYISKKIIAVLMSVLMLTAFLTASALAEESIIKGGDFETDLDYWYESEWHEGRSSFVIDTNTVKSGSAAFCIFSPEANDARIVQKLSVSPSTVYTVTAYVKTSNIKAENGSTSGAGATISVIDTLFMSDSLTGTNDWTLLTFSFKTAPTMRSVELCFTLGGYGYLKSGTAWFDDITVVEDKDATSFHQLQTKKPTTGNNSSSSNKDYWSSYTRQENADQVKWMFFAFLWFVILSALLISFAETGSIGGSQRSIKKVFILVLGVSFIARLIMGLLCPSQMNDMSCWLSWGGQASADLFNMYAGDGFLDYPPLYMYVLAPIGGLANLLWPVWDHRISMCILKLPSIFADIVTAIMLYKLAKKHLGSKWALTIGTFYLANPAVWINSAAWGQVDSFFTMLIVAMLLFIDSKKWWASGIAFALSVLMKPHGIIFTPAIGMVLLIEIFNKVDYESVKKQKKDKLKLFLKQLDFKPILTAVGSGVGAAIILLLPFYIRTNFSEPLWIFKLYFGTIDSYPYVTLNAFNFWALLGYNTVPMKNMFGPLSFAEWGTLGIAFAIVLAVIFSTMGSRKKIIAKESVGAIVSLILIVTVFTFAHKMHERYMFAAIALALVSFILTKDRWFMYLASVFTVAIFANTYMIYNIYVEYKWFYPDPEDIMITLISAFEVLSFLALIAVSIKVLIFNRISKPQSLRDENILPENGKGE